MRCSICCGVGLPWRMLPAGLFPPVSTVQRRFYRWCYTGLWRSINHTLVMLVRELEGCEATPEGRHRNAVPPSFTPRKREVRRGHAGEDPELSRKWVCRWTEDNTPVASRSDLPSGRLATRLDTHGLGRKN